jgi:hypothetical protein
MTAREPGPAAADLAVARVPAALALAPVARAAGAAGGAAAAHSNSGDRQMRVARIIPAILLLLLAAPVLAQDWIEYTSRQDYFSVNLPAQPTVENFTFESEYGVTLNGRRYTATQGASRFIVSVIDYRGQQVTDVRGSIANMATIYRRKGGQVTFDQYAQIDRIEGHQLQITNPDQTRTYVAIHLHKSRLYTLEAVVPPRSPPPILFQASLSILDGQGNKIRYDLDADGVRTQTDGGGQ